MIEDEYKKDELNIEGFKSEEFIDIVEKNEKEKVKMVKEDKMKEK